MDYTFKEVLSDSERSTLFKTHNGNVILQIIDRLHAEGFTSRIQVIDANRKQSFVVTKYEVYIIQGKNITQLSGGTLTFLNSIKKDLQFG